MTREERTQLMTAAVTKLEEAAQLLTTAKEELLADQVNELADIVEVVGTPMGETALRLAPSTPAGS